MNQKLYRGLEDYGLDPYEWIIEMRDVENEFILKNIFHDYFSFIGKLKSTNYLKHQEEVFWDSIQLVMDT